ncbi:hypothetical protein KRMM14A1004_41490 [Krasilnikovia sp. MM14-A1004]
MLTLVAGQSGREDPYVTLQPRRSAGTIPGRRAGRFCAAQCGYSRTSIVRGAAMGLWT